MERKFMTLLLASLLGTLFLASCGGASPDKPKPVVDRGPNIKFHELVYKDSLLIGDSAHYEFKFWNDGRSDLKFTEVYSEWNECTCRYPKDLLPPGKEDRIWVDCAFGMKGRTNVVVRVNSNSAQSTISLVMHCDVFEN